MELWVICCTENCTNIACWIKLVRKKVAMYLCGCPWSGVRCNGWTRGDQVWSHLNFAWRLYASSSRSLVSGSIPPKMHSVDVIWNFAHITQIYSLPGSSQKSAKWVTNQPWNCIKYNYKKYLYDNHLHKCMNNYMNLVLLRFWNLILDSISIRFSSKITIFDSSRFLHDVVHRF